MLFEERTPKARMCQMAERQQALGTSPRAPIRHGFISKTIYDGNSDPRFIPHPSLIYLKMLHFWFVYINQNIKLECKNDLEMSWKFLKLFFYKNREYSFYHKIEGTFGGLQRWMYHAMAFFAWRQLNNEYIKLLKGEIGVESIDLFYTSTLFESIQRFRRLNPSKSDLFGPGQEVLGDVLLGYYLEKREYAAFFFFF